MRYRALSASGDYTFGQGQANFLINSPAAVGQSVLTRLRLWEGEWFLDTTDGTPWLQSVMGKNTQSLYDMAIRARVLETRGVVSIVKYASNLRPDRRLDVTMTINTQFGVETVSTVL